MLGDIDPVNKVPFKRATSRIKKGPLEGGLPNTPQDQGAHTRSQPSVQLYGFPENPIPLNSGI